jgi:hypothetical protein
MNVLFCQSRQLLKQLGTGSAADTVFPSDSQLMAMHSVSICGSPIPGTKSCLSFYARCVLYLEPEGDGCRNHQFYFNASLKLFLNEK